MTSTRVYVINSSFSATHFESFFLCRRHCQCYCCNVDVSFAAVMCETYEQASGKKERKGWWMKLVFLSLFYFRFQPKFRTTDEAICEDTRKLVFFDSNFRTDGNRTKQHKTTETHFEPKCTVKPVTAEMWSRVYINAKNRKCLFHISLCLFDAKQWTKQCKTKRNEWMDEMFKLIQVKRLH